MKFPFTKKDNNFISSLKSKQLEKKEKEYQMEMNAAHEYFERFIRVNQEDIDLTKPLLEVVNLRKQYYGKKHPTIDNLNFKVYPGEFHAFVGANGAGKTTTIKSIIGSYRNFDGSIYISGIDNKNLELRTKMGYIPENTFFPSRISSFDYLYYTAKLNKIKSKEAKLFAESILKKFRMWDLRNQSPNNFSSGQKKKILLAQALSNNPDILIMDEPTANLDPKARIDFFDILGELQKLHKSIFISSHILSELDLYSNAVTILDNGKIVYTQKRNKNENGEMCYRIKLVEDFEGDKVGKYEVNSNNEIIYEFKDKNELAELIDKLISKEILVKFEKYYLSIEDLYKKYVIYGSVDTKETGNLDKERKNPQTFF
nr:ABC transporter ATP-binding protein [Malacoplasma penetrans]